MFGQIREEHGRKRRQSGPYVDGDGVDLALDLDGRAGALVDVEHLVDTLGLDHDVFVVDVVLDGPLLACRSGTPLGLEAPSRQAGHIGAKKRPKRIPHGVC